MNHVIASFICTIALPPDLYNTLVIFNRYVQSINLFSSGTDMDMLHMCPSSTLAFLLLKNLFMGKIQK